ncbi:hypothetical protein, partial [Enterococcus faecium]
MVAAIIYWAMIIISFGWLAVSLYFSIFYLARKENGNLWAFGFLNVITAIIQAIVLVVYRTLGQDWGVTQ